jgi:membrane-associated phospholipid phosphatase
MKKAIGHMRGFIRKYRHAWVFIYIPFYLLWFFRLEKTTQPTHMHIIKFAADSKIPFCAYFIIPYYFWFIYIFATGFYFFLTNRRDFYRYCLFLFTGMSICLFVCQIWPNGINLRPDLNALGRDNIFIDMVKELYRVDTPTNVCPSIHVLNSIGATLAILKSEALMNRKPVRIASVVICLSICASTVLLKQHSCFDVLCGIGLSIVLYLLTYNLKFSKIEADVKSEEELLQHA